MSQHNPFYTQTGAYNDMDIDTYDNTYDPAVLQSYLDNDSNNTNNDSNNTYRFSPPVNKNTQTPYQDTRYNPLPESSNTPSFTSQERDTIRHTLSNEPSQYDFTPHSPQEYSNTFDSMSSPREDLYLENLQKSLKQLNTFLKKNIQTQPSLSTTSLPPTPPSLSTTSLPPTPPPDLSHVPNVPIDDISLDDY